MDNVLISLVEKLPSGYLMALIPVLVVCGIWLFTHIRRDKQGKIYFYSQKYEDKKRNRKQDLILEKAGNLEKDVLQLQVCAVELPPTAKRLAYHKYKKLGYNGWMDEYVVEKGLLSKEEVAYISTNTEDA
jgi:hypothetical protein